MRNFPLSKGDAFIVEDRIGRYYFTGIDIAEGCLIVSERPTYFADMRYFVALKEKLAGSGIDCKPLFSDDDIKNELAAQGISRAYIDFDTTTVKRYEKLKTFCKETSDGSEIFTDIRSVKSEEELSYLKKACDIIERAVADAFSYIKKGMTEREVREFIIKRSLELGAEGEAFDTIVAFGKNSAVPHHETGDTVLTENVAVLIDTGIKIKGYCSDITRTAFFGTPDDEFLRAYDAVLNANLLAEKNVCAGMSGIDADKIARDHLTEKGYGRYFTHSLGHGVGLLIHEKPYLSPKSKDYLADNKAFTVEPGVYFENKFGIRIEDTCVMKDGRAERLYKDDKSLIIIR